MLNFGLECSSAFKLKLNFHGNQLIYLHSVDERLSIKQMIGYTYIVYDVHCMFYVIHKLLDVSGFLYFLT